MLMNMTEILSVAEEQKFAVPAFNIGSGVILNGVMDTCEKLNAPVILVANNNNKYALAANYATSNGISGGVALGGTTRINNTVMQKIFK